MALFGFGKSTKTKKYPLSVEARYWIHEDFGWLFSNIQLSENVASPYQFNPETFPMAHEAPTFIPANVINDLCTILDLDVGAIQIEMMMDERDQERMPYEIEGTVFESALTFTDGHYHLLIANSLLKVPNRLLYNLIRHALQLKLYSHGFQIEQQPINEAFLFATGVYLGFGELLVENMFLTQKIVDAGWESNRNFGSEISYEYAAYAIALFYFILENGLEWIERLPGDIQKLIKHATEFILTEKELQEIKNDYPLNQHFITAETLYLRQQYNEAIALMQLVLAEAFSARIRAAAENNWGYYLLLTDKFEESIPHFKIAIQLYSNLTYAYDNLGFALLRIGELEKGKSFADKSAQMEGNNMAFTNRNLGLYYFLMGDDKLAQEHYEQACNAENSVVDLSEFHYAQLLIKIGDPEKAQQILQPAINRGEIQAIQLNDQIQNGTN